MYRMIIGLLFCAVAVSGGALLRYVSSPQQVIEADRLSHDFGDVVFEQDCETEFTLRNDARRPITIESVRSSCGCLVPEDVDGTLIAPGKSAAIKLKLSTRGISPPKQLTKHVLVSYDAADPTNLAITAHIKPEVVVEPRTLQFDGKPVKLALSRCMMSGEKFRELKFDYDSLYEVREVERTDDSLVVEVELVRRPASSDLSPIRVVLGDNASFNRRLPTITCRRSGPVISPRAYFHAVDRDAEVDALVSASRQIFSVESSFRDFEVVDIKSEEGAAFVQTQIVSANQFQVCVTKVPDGPLDAAIVIHYKANKGRVAGSLALPISISTGK